MDPSRATPCLLLLLATSACLGPGKLRPFSSDGCSMFPDGSLVKPSSWKQCCLVHDMAYWRGGTHTQRLKADRALRRCVEEVTGDHALAESMYWGVRAGGSPYFPNSYRWGYGWQYERLYSPLDEDERRLTGEAMTRWLRKHPDAPRPPWAAEAPQQATARP